MTLDELSAHPPYDLTAAEKEAALSGILSKRTRSHYANCEAYRKILDRLGFDPHADHATRDLPFIPVRLFKTLELRSVPKESIVKTLTSSGTSGQAVSRIFLDAENVRVFGEPRDGLRRDRRARPSGNIVKHQRNAAFVRDRGEVTVKSFLRRLVVIRRHLERAPGGAGRPDRRPAYDPVPAGRTALHLLP